MNLFMQLDMNQFEIWVRSSDGSRREVFLTDSQSINGLITPDVPSYILLRNWTVLAEEALRTVAIYLID